MSSLMIAPAISGAAQFALGSIFGKKAPKVNTTIPGFSAGGLSASFDGQNYSVAPSQARMDAVNNLAATFGEQADMIGDLRESVAPGVGAYTAARMAQVDNARTRSIGDLRENLQRRRVLGSSFAADALARADAEFGLASDQVAADSWIKSIDMENSLGSQEFAARRGEVQTGLDEMNLEANLAASLTGKATEVLGKSAIYDAILASQAQQGMGKLVGTAFQPLFKSISGTNTSSLFGNSGGGRTLLDLMPTDL